MRMSSSKKEETFPAVVALVASGFAAMTTDGQTERRDEKHMDDKFIKID